ncbi:hypothetical protein HHI36_019125 [Cryptolaemus montrouzieri]|uniref:Proteasome assembly chaperone 3 n=1 Tax=Cryptolaemus montrouzieri TaxID=559131 RepID=A0ABD2P2V0_9CUCU
MENLNSAISSLKCNQVPSNIINFAAEIDGNTTEFVVVKFNNQDLLIITQFLKISTLYKVEIDNPNPDNNISEIVYSVSHLSGSENPIALAAVRFIAEKLNFKKTTHLFFDLRNYEKSVVTDIVDIILNKTNDV